MEIQDSSPTHLLTRRGFIGSAAAAAAVTGYGMFSPTAFAGTRTTLPYAGRMGELDASDPAGIDLYIDRQPLLVGETANMARAAGEDIEALYLQMGVRLAF